jgi:hypothetical protein
MGLYVRGETGDPCARNLLSAIEVCERQWAGDRAYRDVLFKLDQVEQELDLLTASAGHRAAMRAHEANPSGQEPSRGREERLEAQRG